MIEKNEDIIESKIEIREKREKRRKCNRIMEMKNLNACIDKFIDEVSENNKEEINWIYLLDNKEEFSYEFQGNMGQMRGDDSLENQKSIVQEFLITFFEISIKPITSIYASKWRYIEDTVKNSKKHTLLEQFDKIEYFFIRKKFKRITQILEAVENSTEIKDFRTWRIWFNLFHKKKTSASLLESSCIFSKLCKIYSILYSNSWGSYISSINTLISYNLQDLESIIYADILLYNNNPEEEPKAINLLNTALLGSYGKLAFLRLLKHYFQYNSFHEAQMLCIYAKNKFQGEILELAEAFHKKTEGKLKNISVPIHTNNMLVHYYFARACIKYNLKLPIEKVKFSIEFAEKVLESENMLKNVFSIKVLIT